MALHGSKLGWNVVQSPPWHCVTVSHDTLHQAFPYSHCTSSSLHEEPVAGAAAGQTGLHGVDESAPPPSVPPPPSDGPGPESWVPPSAVPASPPPPFALVNTLPPHPRVRPATAVAAARRAIDGTRMEALLGPRP
jgi:hypothetical protein